MVLVWWGWAQCCVWGQGRPRPQTEPWGKSSRDMASCAVGWVWGDTSQECFVLLLLASQLDTDREVPRKSERKYDL